MARKPRRDSDAHRSGKIIRLGNLKLNVVCAHRAEETLTAEGTEENGVHERSQSVAALAFLTLESRHDQRALMLDRNSLFPRVLLSLSISNSIASTGESGFRTLRRTQMRDRSSFGISSSSLRVPER
jgi:hypothetical protein